MLQCIPCSKQIGGHRSLEEKDEEGFDATPSKKAAVKGLTAQIREMAVKASGAYKSCKPCSGSDNKGQKYSDSEDAYSEKVHCSYRRTGGANSSPKFWGKGMKGSFSGERTPASSRSESLILTDEDEPKEWVAHVEPGVLITFVSLPQGGNELKKIRFRERNKLLSYKMAPAHRLCFFSRDMFNKWQAQRWWTGNYDKVIELYNVQRFNRQTVPLQTPLRSEDEGSNVESLKGGPMTPPLNKERLLSNLHRVKETEDSSLDSPDRQPEQSCQHNDKTQTSSVDVSARSSSSYETDHSGQLSVSNASDLETEWVEQDEPGVYITIRELPGGIRELRRVRFSREKFGEMHARLWWEENRARIQEQYL